MMRVGRIRDIVRYPVKSMAGTPIESTSIGWHGLAGDRRFALLRVGERSGMPWLTASRLPELLLYQPTGLDERSGEPLPTHVRTPSGACVGLRSPELTAELTERFGTAVDLMKLDRGIFDDGAVSVIGLATIAAIGREAGLALDRRRFRANIVLETEPSEPFVEDRWVGRMLALGDAERGPIVSVTTCDVRCMMINLDPDTAQQNPRVMKAAVKLNQNNAGVYATVVRTGTVAIGEAVHLVS